MDRILEYYLFASQNIKFEINLTKRVIGVTIEGNKSLMNLDQFKTDIGKFLRYIERMEKQDAGK